MAPADSIHVVGGAILDGARCLVAQRGPRMRLPGRWEFPGGKLEPREGPARALAREIHEELGLEVEVGDWLGRGESRVGQDRIRLDVYSARQRGGTLHLREHARVAWLGEAELGPLDWAEADVPVLPAVRARLRANVAASRCPGQVPVVAADWSSQPRHRAVYVARSSPEPTLVCEESPTGGWDLAHLLLLAERLRQEGGTAVIVGIDAVLGVPSLLAHRAGCRGFLDCLSMWERSGGLGRECRSVSSWSPERPFFRVPKGRGALSRFVDAAGGRSALLRQIELRTGARSVFILSGIPGSVGSGSRTLWRELAPLLGHPDRSFRVWPFEGGLRSLAERSHVILAEVYPRAAYAIALEEQLPARPRSLAKSSAAIRASALHELQGARWLQQAEVEISGLAQAQASEDDFDALLTAAALSRLLLESRPLSGELIDPDAEGGILATGTILSKPGPERR